MPFRPPIAPEATTNRRAVPHSAPWILLLAFASCPLAPAAAAPQEAIRVGLYGDNGRLAALVAGDARLNLQTLNRLAPQDFANLRVLVVTRSVPLAGPDSTLVRELRAFVARGNGLMLAGDACASVSSPFPEAMSGLRHPKEATKRGQIVDSLLKVTDGRWIIEEFEGWLFQASAPQHYPLKMGPGGRTVVLDRYDWPVVIGGPDGLSGRIIFSGCDYSHLAIPSPEAEVTRELLLYLAGLAGGPRKP